MTKPKGGPPSPHLERPTVRERAASGKAARTQVPLDSHARWEPAKDRSHPVDLLEEQAKTRIPELVPIRYGRMLVSPFSYFRGAALPMAADLSTTPVSGFSVQACGDAHLSNFGVFGSPERHLIFDVNDFDETAPGPWEWDLKRLTASLEIAGRDNGFEAKVRRATVRRTAQVYRETVRQFAAQPMLDVWYAHLDIGDLLPRFQALLDASKTPDVWRAITNARAHDSHQAFDKLCRVVNGEARIISDPPLIIPVEELLGGVDPVEVSKRLNELLSSYQRTLQTDRRRLLERYQLVHVARKVVGVGSVGTGAWVGLLVERDHGTPLLLQIKEAEASVLERFTSPSEFANHGQRVVAGQRLMQAASDIFLGWERSVWEGDSRDYYIRQLRDWKGSADVKGMTPAGLDFWGRLCGWTLARAHARSGDRIAMAAYLGKSDTFDRAIVDFSVAYADQNERDYKDFQHAVAGGRLVAETGL
jgi:uncharacterized protein (DUF2252 family)